jgi:hypothetical protein
MIKIREKKKDVKYDVSTWEEFLLIRKPVFTVEPEFEKFLYSLLEKEND